MPPQLMQNNSIELCDCSFHIQHQANLTTLICNYESILFCVSTEQRNPFMLQYISRPEFGLNEQNCNTTEKSTINYTSTENAVCCVYVPENIATRTVG